MSTSSDEGIYKSKLRSSKERLYLPHELSKKPFPPSSKGTYKQTLL